MSRRLVIHVGAQKCASSSLQASLKRVQQALNGDFGYCFLNPAQLRAADQALLAKKSGALGYVDRVLSNQKADQVVISHEMLGNRPALVSAIADRAIHAHSFDHVVISGYTRLQSNYHVSAFAQWFFRDRKRLAADVELFRGLGLPWRKFTAQERSLFALALSGKDRNWCANYKQFLSGVKHLSDRVQVVSCHIPTRRMPYSLLTNFVDSSGLCLGVNDLASMDVRKNQSFHPVVVQGVSNFSSALPVKRQSFFPGPHEGNRWLFRVCDRLAAHSNVMDDFEALFSPVLEHCLVNHLDCRTFASNRQYCELMSVDKSYFKPSSEAALMSSEELKDLAAQTASTRKLKAIEMFNRSVENALFNAARLEIISV